jgi:thioredoxin-related protein
MILSIGSLACSDGESNRSAVKNDGKISWKNIEEAAEVARLQNKKLFVYVHTDWCSWCRRMEEETFSNDAVAEYMNDKFIPVSLDAESQRRVTFNGQRMTEQAVAAEFGVEGFPTHIFLTSDGEPIRIAPGYLPPDRFIDVLSFIAEDHYRYMNWEEYRNRKVDNS